MPNSQCVWTLNLSFNIFNCGVCIAPVIMRISLLYVHRRRSAIPWQLIKHL
uniref:Uncharacterized protein n=1 Tax=Anopheles arabiensis TaxID=7173 RepID=A0A182IFS5_ANOAR